jgi:hypothetical protein
MVQSLLVLHDTASRLVQGGGVGHGAHTTSPPGSVQKSKVRPPMQSGQYSGLQPLVPVQLASSRVEQYDGVNGQEWSRQRGGCSVGDQQPANSLPPHPAQYCGVQPFVALHEVSSRPWQAVPASPPPPPPTSSGTRPHPPRAPSAATPSTILESVFTATRNSIRRAADFYPRARVRRGRGASPEPYAIRFLRGTGAALLLQLRVVERSGAVLVVSIHA